MTLIWSHEQNVVLITVSTSAGLYVPQTPVVDSLPVFYAARVSYFSSTRVRFTQLSLPVDIKWWICFMDRTKNI